MFRSSYSYGAATALIHWGDHQNLWDRGISCCADKFRPVIAAKCSLKLRCQRTCKRISHLQRRAAWQEFHIPAAAERLDQRDDGKKAILHHGQRGLLVGKQLGLGNDDGGEGNGTGLILIEINIDLLLRRLDRVVDDFLLAR